MGYWLINFSIQGRAFHAEPDYLANSALTI